jgi:glutaredoxin
MTLVEIFSKEGCHLCEIAKETILRIRQSHSFELREIRIREGDEFFDQMKDRIPVIHINHEFAFQHRIREEEFVAKLGSAALRGDT